MGPGIWLTYTGANVGRIYRRDIRTIEGLSLS